LKRHRGSIDLSSNRAALMGVLLNLRTLGLLFYASMRLYSGAPVQALTHLFDVLFRLGVFDPTSDDVFSSVLHP
tara:strand:+ start:226 stop:447 length:222 start_codon:yes stop_codon:yes gene_type:complete